MACHPCVNSVGVKGRRTAAGEAVISPSAVPFVSDYSGNEGFGDSPAKED
jgi:hypothetical protein